MPTDPRIRALANKAAVRIKALSEAHESQIEAIYQEFRRKAALITEGNADSLDGSNVTPTQPTTRDRREREHYD